MIIPDRQFLLIGSTLTFFLTLALYVISMPTTITLEDAGLFQMVCHEGGIGHPPGYPVFVLACQGFVALPFFSGDVFAGNLLNAIIAAAACAILVPTMNELLADRSLAVFVALAYGLSSTFWSQAIIIEVYSLAALMFVGCLWLCLIFRRTGNFKVLVGLAFLYGLSLANHWPLQILASPFLLAVLLPRWKDVIGILGRPALLLAVFLAGLLGLTPYLLLFQESPVIAVYGGIETVDQFIRYVSRAPYDDQFAAATWLDKLQYQGWVWRQTLAEFSYFLAPLILVGIVVSFRRIDLDLAVGSVLLYLGGTSLLILLLGFEYSALRTAIFRPYPILAYLAVAIWLGVGCYWLFEKLRAYNSRVVAYLPIALVLIIAVDNFDENYRANDRFVASYIEQLLVQTPENSVLFVAGDTGVGAVGFQHHVVGERSDIELRSWNSLVFNNRLSSAFAPQQMLDETRAAFVMNSDRRVLSNIQPDYPAINRGLLFEASEQPGFECDSSQHDYLLHLVNLDTDHESILDAHEQELLFGLLMAFTRQHTGLALSGQADAEEFAVLQSLQQSFAGKLATLETLLQYPQDSASKVLLSAMAEAAADTLPEGASSQVAGLVDEYRGRIALLEEPNPELAVMLLQSSLDKNPTDANASRCLLPIVLRQLNKLDRAEDIEAEFGSCNLGR